MKIVAPILPVMLILCVAVAFVTFKTFQLQSQINVLFAMSNESSDVEASQPPTVVLMHADTSQPNKTTNSPVKITVEEELAKEVDIINEDEKEAEELRCQLRTQSSSCKGSVKEMKRKVKASSQPVTVTTADVSA